MIRAFEGSIVTIPSAEPVEIVLMERRCWSCGDRKSLFDDFSVDRARKHGRDHICRHCKKVRRVMGTAP